jgi:hypothetical protein
MNYYDPFLAAWVLVSNGQALAAESLTATNGFNTLLEGIYQGFSIPVADVATTFQINNTAQIPIVKLPVNVFLTLTPDLDGRTCAPRSRYPPQRRRLRHNRRRLRWVPQVSPVLRDLGGGHHETSSGIEIRPPAQRVRQPKLCGNEASSSSNC